MSGPRHIPMTADRLLKHIIGMTRQEGECWIWTGSFTGSRQPMMRVNGTKRTVRSAVMEFIKGEPTPTGSVVSNTCECSACVNPDHAVNVTKAKMLERSMRNTNQELRAAKISAGHARNKKLSDEQVAMVLESDKTGLVLAAELGVHFTLISHYRRRKSVRARQHNNPFAGLGARV